MPGRTGFAHLFEHVMFTGSGHVPYGLHDKLTEGVGGGNNGSTTTIAPITTRTIPANYLESALWLESDRMGSCSTSSTREAQRAARRREERAPAELRQSTVWPRERDLLGAMYPKDHPYSWPVIGSMTDLSAASEEDVKAFFRLTTRQTTQRSQSSATSIRNKRRRGFRNTFSDLPQGKTWSGPTCRSASSTRASVLVYEDRVQVPRLYIQWPTSVSRATTTTRFQ
jgi:zinc protease